MTDKRVSRARREICFSKWETKREGNAEIPLKVARRLHNRTVRRDSKDVIRKELEDYDEAETTHSAEHG